MVANGLSNALFGGLGTGFADLNGLRSAARCSPQSHFSWVCVNIGLDWVRKVLGTFGPALLQPGSLMAITSISIDFRIIIIKRFYQANASVYSCNMPNGNLESEGKLIPWLTFITLTFRFIRCKRQKTYRRLKSSAFTITLKSRPKHELAFHNSAGFLPTRVRGYEAFRTNLRCGPVADLFFFFWSFWLEPLTVCIRGALLKASEPNSTWLPAMSMLTNAGFGQFMVLVFLYYT